jgi:hypothetical protein
LRLQLIRRTGALGLVAACGLVASEARAEDAEPAPSNLTTRASAEVSGYLDSVSTTVLTPSVAGSVENPVAGWSLSGRYLADVVSAASPDIVATASPPFKEVRNAGNLGFRYKPGNYGVNASTLASYTPDYLSVGGGLDFIEDLNDKNLTLSEGYHYGHDVIGRAGTSFSTFSRQLDIHSFTLGASTTVNPTLVVGVTADGILERGDHSKPYRYIPIFAPVVGPLVPRGASVAAVAATRLQARPLEQLPLERDRLALTGHVAWRLGTRTLRMDERLYGDSWSQYASTTDVRYFIDASRRVIVWPHLRFHGQNAVSFWQRAYTATGPGDLPALRTGDRELSALINVGAGGGLRFALGRRGRLDDWAWTTTLDGTWTSFADALYVKTRWSSILTTALEAVF